MTFTLPPLPYAYNALEPFIDEQTMMFHHDKHHAAYVEKLNAALEKYPDLQTKSIEELLKNVNSLPEDIKVTVKNNGGGHFNHTLFWDIMTPGGSKTPVGQTKNLIEIAFGNFEAFVEKFSASAVGRFGSGWVWLVKTGDRLEITDTPNQDNPLMDKTGTPILGLDVWEHAYYIQYKWQRADYVSAWWNLVNWEKVEGNLQQAV
ncbi:MAG: superoxide dismutase [Patescibacteria group bacterium]